jgi:beta-glucosidase
MQISLDLKSFLSNFSKTKTKSSLLLAGSAIIASLAACSPNSEHETRAQKILSKMTLEEKVGQVIQGDISTVTPEDAKKYNLGSVLNGGNSAPGGGKTATWQQWVDAADAYYLASTDTSDGGIGVPLLWGTDAVHGHNNLQMAVIFPHNSALGATGDADLLRRIGAATAREVKATALDWVFAPTLAVARDDRWGRAYESYSEDQKIVSDLGAAILEGLQGKAGSENFLDENRVIATAKHFVGDGGTQYGIDKGDTIGSIDDITKIHAFPYRAAIDGEVQTVMASFSSVNGEKMHGSKSLLTDVLRRDMGFDGFVIGDWNGHAEIPGCTSTNCPDAFLAGVDMYMAPDSWRGLYDSLLAQVKSGAVPMARLDEAVLRILTVKVRAGLFEAGLPSKRPAVGRSNLGSEDHQALGREAVRKSLVLLKNDKNLLPFKPSSHIAVVGEAAKSMGQQTGGWTLSWQGEANKNEEFETGQTIYAGLKEKIDAAGGRITYAKAASELSDKPDLVIYVFGEKPYAEFFGDMSDVVFEFEDGNAISELAALKKLDVPIVSLFLTGRPLWINPHVNASDAFVVGWLPGTQAGGIADVLAADENGLASFDFTGRLSFSWPADGSGSPIDSTSASGVQFPLGYGLSYASEPSEFETLSEAPGILAPSGTFDGIIMSRGAAKAPFGFFLGDSSNWKTPADSFLGNSLGGTLKSQGIDYSAQEDARKLVWRGEARGLASLQTQRQIDFGVMGEIDELNMELTYRLDKEPVSPVLWGMSCGDYCGVKTVDITEVLKKKSEGEWQKLSLPLRCFVEAGIDPSSIKAPMLLETSGSLTLSLTKLVVVKGAGECPKK